MKYFCTKVANFDKTEGIIEGFASVFGVKDSWGDVVTEKAFDRTLDEKTASDIRMLRGHNPNVIIGEWTEMDIREQGGQKGFFMKGQLYLDMEDGKNAAKLIQRKQLDGLSIGAGIVKGTSTYGDDGTRFLNDLDLLENSVVTFPANTKARISTIKTAHDLALFKRQIEDILCDANIHREDAREIVAKGVTDELIRREADTLSPEVLKALDDFNKLIKTGL